jgi:hypothetical protein
MQIAESIATFIPNEYISQETRQAAWNGLLRAGLLAETLALTETKAAYISP